MRSRLPWVALLAMVSGGCAPYRIVYKQLVLEDVPGLTVLQRSKPGESSYEKNVRQRKYGLPLRYTLRREAYTLVLSTPLNGSHPVVLIGAQAADGSSLVIDGGFITGMHPDAQSGNREHPHMFDWKKADGAPLEFVVRDASGGELGKESFTYEIVKYGVVTGIETL